MKLQFTDVDTEKIIETYRRDYVPRVESTVIIKSVRYEAVSVYYDLDCENYDVGILVRKLDKQPK